MKRIMMLPVMTMALASQAGGQTVARAPVEIVVGASGTSRAKADVITVSVQIQSSATTARQARSDNAAKIARFRAALTAAGIDAAAIRAVTPRAPFGFVGNNGYDDAVMADGVPGSAIMPAHAGSQFDVELTSPAQFDAVTKLLDNLDLKMVGPAVPSLKDSKPETLRAIAAAVADAKWRGDAYAAAINMRVVAVKRVGTACDTMPYATTIDAQMMKMFNGTREDDRWMVETSASVCVTYLAN